MKNLNFYKTRLLQIGGRTIAGADRLLNTSAAISTLLMAIPIFFLSTTVDEADFPSPVGIDSVHIADNINTSNHTVVDSSDKYLPTVSRPEDSNKQGGSPSTVLEGSKYNVLESEVFASPEILNDRMLGQVRKIVPMPYNDPFERDMNDARLVMAFIYSLDTLSLSDEIRREIFEIYQKYQTHDYEVRLAENSGRSVDEYVHERKRRESMTDFLEIRQQILKKIDEGLLLDPDFFIIPHLLTESLDVSV